MTSIHYKPLKEGGSDGGRLCCMAALLSAGLLTLAALMTVIYLQVYSNSVGGLVLVDNGAGLHIYPPPPPYREYARVARYLVHISDWASLATVSTHAGIEGYPFDNVFSISDGVGSNSSGTPYFYLTPIELSVMDLEKDPRASMTVSLAQSSYCRQQELDPQDPRCAHLILTGEMVKVKAGSPEELFARAALFERHPEMMDWPTDHGWFVARLAIRHIYLLDFFGGAEVVDPKDYYAASPTQDLGQQP